MSLRLEPLPANGSVPHPQTVALLWGPLVLFALRQPGETARITLSSSALLQAQRSGPHEWTVTDPTGTRTFVPFVDVGDNSYSTYMTLT